MGKATLVIMAAGIGSRFGKGIKQLEPIGPGGEIIMDYSVYDALEAGFDKVVFVIRRDIEKDFKEIIGKRLEKLVKVDYVYQELDNIPEKYLDKFGNRTKPWGTGQAVLCCKNIIHEPFVVINADDYYGKEAFKVVGKYLSSCSINRGHMSICMVGFTLGNTLSENGGETRGICKVDNEDMLLDIVETHNIIKTSDGLITSEESHDLSENSVVSMNMWGLNPDFINILEEGFEKFLKEVKEGDLKSEYLLPTIIGQLLRKKTVEVKVLRSADKWFGITYKEDKIAVGSGISSLIECGIYPPCLFN